MMANRNSGEIRYLVLMLTNRCNLRCWYCYCPEPADTLDMSEEIMERAVDLAASHALPLHVQLSGGEPCLNPRLLRRTVWKVRTDAPHATIAVQTNATLIGEEVALLFKENAVQVGISIDGPPSVHEAVRGRFAELYRGIETLETHGVPWRATAVVTADSVAHLWRLAALIARFGTARGIGLDFLTRKGRSIGGGPRPASPDMVANGIGRMLETLDAINRKRTVPIRLRESDMVADRLSRGATAAFCHVCEGESMAVRADGSVYPCGQLCGEPRYFAGNIRAGIDWPALRLNGPRLRFEDCRSCELRGRCPGDCPSRLRFNETSVNRNTCALYRTIFAHQRKETTV
jgi:uncharacterized protein